MRQNSDEKLNKVRQSAYRLLKVRGRSEKELRTRLSRNKFSKTLIAKIIIELKALGLVNDRKFSYNWVESRLHKGLGLYRIRAELAEKGITKALIEKTLVNATTGYDEASVINELIKQRIKRYDGLDRNIIKRRLYGYLSRKGFSGEKIFELLKKYEN